MPERKTVERAQQEQRKGHAGSTQAGAFVKEEIDRVRAHKTGARSSKQAIAIGLSKARRAGVDVKTPKPGTSSASTRKKAQTDAKAGKSAAAEGHAKSPKRARASAAAMQREGHAAASHKALSEHSHQSASRRSAASRSAAAKQGARTKGAAARSAAAKKAAHTRAARAH